MCVLSLQLCPTLCDTVDCLARQALLSMGFSRQEYWSWLPCPPLGDLPDPGIKPMFVLPGKPEMTHRTQKNACLHLWFIVKGEKLETAKWKICTRQSMWKVRDMNDFHALSQHISMFSNLEAR